MDRKHVTDTFRRYVSGYNMEDPKIALKAEHTYHVAENADRIARSLSLQEGDVDLAWLLGMLHDIGRFEQVRRYETFNDAKSVQHAHLSCEVLFPEEYKAEPHFFDEMPGGRFGRLEDYVPELMLSDSSEVAETRQLIDTAISLHSVFRLPAGLTEREKLFCNLLRDADKVDILRVNVQTPLTDIINCTEEEIRTSTIADCVVTAIREHHVVKRSADFVMSPADHVAAHCCLAFELVYPESRRLAVRQGYLKKLLSFRNEQAETNAVMELLGQEMGRFLQEAEGHDTE